MFHHIQLYSLGCQTFSFFHAPSHCTLATQSHPPSLFLSLSLSLSLSLCHTEKVDYAESERVIRFDSSHTSSSAPECVSIPIIDDDILEDRETYLMEVKKVDEDLPYRLEPFTVYCAIDDNDSEWWTKANPETIKYSSPHNTIYLIICALTMERNVGVQMQ